MEEQFPILRSLYSKQEYVPFWIVKLHERQAKMNHGGQSVEVLKQRHGLSWPELYYVITDQEYPRELEGDDNYYRDAVKKIIATYTK